MLLWSFFQVQCTEWDFFSWGGGGGGRGLFLVWFWYVDMPDIFFH